MQAQEILDQKGNLIDLQAEIVRDEVMDKKFTSKQIEEEFAACLTAKAEREEAEYVAWERQQFESKYKTKIDGYKDQAKVEFKNGSYEESINLYGKALQLLEITKDDFGEVLKKDIGQYEAQIFGNLAYCY